MAGWQKRHSFADQSLRMPVKTLIINGKFLSQQATGVQKYALGLSRVLQLTCPGVIIAAPAGSYPDAGLRIRKSRMFKGWFWEQYILPLQIYFRKDRILLNLCNSAPIILRRQAVAIHDLAVYRDPSWFSFTFRTWYRFLLPRITRKARLVLCVSEHIRQEMISRFGLPAEKIILIPNGLPDIRPDKDPPFPFPYLMLTGVHNPRKNAAFVLRLIGRIRSLGWQVVATGSDAAIFGDRKAHRQEGLHLNNYVSEGRYYSWLQHAGALIFPSHYEGFGIPVLEALSMGVPVILPDRPEYRQNFGRLPHYYEDQNEESFLRVLAGVKNHRPDPSDVLLMKNMYNFERSAALLAEQLNISPAQ